MALSKPALKNVNWSHFAKDLILKIELNGAPFCEDIKLQPTNQHRGYIELKMSDWICKVLNMEISSNASSACLLTEAISIYSSDIIKIISRIVFGLNSECSACECTAWQQFRTYTRIARKFCPVKRDDEIDRQVTSIRNLEGIFGPRHLSHTLSLSSLSLFSRLCGWGAVTKELRLECNIFHLEN